MPLWPSLIQTLSEITRDHSNPVICCPHCGNQHNHTKWGRYFRRLFDDTLEPIQRYRCYNDKCPYKTFSILPHAFLRIIQPSLCMLMVVLDLYENGHCIAEIARQTKNTWSRTQRWIRKALSIREWIHQEYGNKNPCLSPDRRWSHFIRDFSWAFYPGRYPVPCRQHNMNIE